MKHSTYDLDHIPQIKTLTTDADHIDIKTIEGDLPLREFVANLLSHQPGWVTFLYRVRWGFVRLFGMEQKGVPRPAGMRPDDVPMTRGEAAYFFIVEAAEDGKFWIAGAKDKHLDAYLGVVLEALDANRFRYHVLTIVHYNNWAGPVYFNVIRPFHHVVVGAMVRAAVKPSP